MNGVAMTPDESILHVTDSLTIEANGATFVGNNQFVTTSGQVTPFSYQNCPSTERTALVVGFSRGLFRVGERGVDNSGIEVTVNDLRATRIKQVALVHDGAKITFQNLEAIDLQDMDRCDTAVISAEGSADVTLESSTIDQWTNYSDLNTPNFLIAGGDGKLEIYDSTLSLARNAYAVAWRGDSDIVTTRIEDAGGLFYLGSGTHNLMNSLVLPAVGEMSTLTFVDNIYVGAGATLNVRASSIIYPLTECSPFGTTGRPRCTWQPDGAVNRSTVQVYGTLNLLESALHVQNVDPSFHPSEGALLIEELSGGVVNVDQAFIQPIALQTAIDLQALTGASAPDLLTGADALPLGLAIGLSFPSFATPITSGGAQLVDRVLDAGIGGANDLLDPRGNRLTTDILDAPRTDGAPEVRSIGAVQNHVIPFLAVTTDPSDPNRADLAWTQPKTPGINGYDLCYGSGSAPNLASTTAVCPGTQIPQFSSSATDLVGEISGLPDAATVWFFVRASVGGTGEPWSNEVEVNTTVSITYPPVSIATGPVPPVAPAVSGTLTAPTFTVVSGCLPAGLVLDSTTGVISGQASSVGTCGSVGIQVTYQTSSGAGVVLATVLFSITEQVPIPVWMAALLALSLGVVGVRSLRNQCKNSN
ncbi:Ig domain-containing protein [Seongchinamella unica]|uniref:Ig domain-containing protein n=1 Tax=Seongchinamella unica TaxID=2547392 RepID=UPI00105819E3|nr:Ig domain-containing protein [Seongchinamella unica]